MNAKMIINHLCDRYGARSYDLTPWTRVWQTRSGHTYCVKSDPFVIFHRHPDGRKRNYNGDERGALNFIDRMEERHG